MMKSLGATERRPWRVLIADDMAPMRNLLRAVLRKHGIQDFLLAEDGVEAVSIFLEESKYDVAPDIVMLDIDMPKMNGLEVLQEIRAVDPDVFIVMISANSTLNSVNHAIESQVNSFLVKPIRPSQVEELVEKFELFMQ